MGQYRCYLVSIEASSLTQYSCALGSTNNGAGIHALARAVASSPDWRQQSNPTLVARTGSQPALIVLGSFDEAFESHIRAEAIELDRTCGRLQYVSYLDVERECQVLAKRLIRRFGKRELRRFRFVSIPRGGPIVLGLLSYALQLEREQLEVVDDGSDEPLVVVDDCALTGIRFHQFSARYPGRQLVFAPLYSHPGLRSSIEAEEPEVLACLSGQDLHDYGPEQMGDHYPAWQERWRERLQGRRYWVGLARHLCFPWKETNRLLWNPVTERVEIAWHVVPPELCLENRIRPAVQIQVHVPLPAGGPLRSPDHVFYCEHEGGTVVGNLRIGEVIGLTGAGRQMWDAIVEQGTLEAATEVLLRHFDVPAETLKDDLSAFVKDLLARGFLEDGKVTGEGKDASPPGRESTR